MEEEAESPPPPFDPFAFLRKPLFIFGALFVAWIFLGRLIPGLTPHASHMATAPDTAVTHNAPLTSTVQPPQDIVKQKDAQIAELQQRLDALEVKLKAPGAAAPSATPPVADDEKISALEAKIDALTQAHATQNDDAAHMEELLHKQSDELAALKIQLADTQAQGLHRLSLMAAFQTLREAIEHGEDFSRPLAQMNDLAKNDEQITTLLNGFTPYAQHTAPTLSELQSQFETLAPQALSAPNANEVMRHLQSLIRIRKVGDQPGSSDEAIIARAETSINHGDIENTLKELAGLSPQGTAAFAPWVVRAQAYLHLREQLNALQLALLQNNPTAAAP